ncbi:hypothetical protein CUR178_07499 [Leishmania enriettii]|uniref:Uncharacterized protein n=1 Tax=Leishmania enriettii TaxID=5663 RepID=A0A836HZV4_LEIEN|nr:hypothetical protein CUR178_07499 [Leishmania enriettii]
MADAHDTKSHRPKVPSSSVMKTDADMTSRISCEENMLMEGQTVDDKSGGGEVDEGYFGDVVSALGGGRLGAWAAHRTSWTGTQLEVAARTNPADASVMTTASGSFTTTWLLPMLRRSTRVAGGGNLGRENDGVADGRRNAPRLLCGEGVRTTLPQTMRWRPQRYCSFCEAMATCKRFRPLPPSSACQAPPPCSEGEVAGSFIGDCRLGLLLNRDGHQR